MVFVERKFLVSDQSMAEILVAELADLGDFSFEIVEEDDAVQCTAYGTAAEFERCAAQIDSIVMRYAIEGVTSREIASQNWNAAWESDYPPCDVADGRVRIRTPFHEANPDAEFEVIISPEMSFGTGHHPTTAMMVEYIVEQRPMGGAVLDVGCGTGILSIVACKCGAATIDAVEIDSGAYENALQNFALNGLEGRIEARCGSVEQVSGRRYDTILANIHLNVIASQMGWYASALNNGGQLYASGLYAEDMPQLVEVAREHNFALLSSKQRDGWVALCFGRIVE